MTTPEAHEPDPTTDPIRVAEVVVAAYQWDAWREAASAAQRAARVWSVMIGVATTAAAVWAGVALLPGTARFSAIIYAPLIGWPVITWVRSFIARRRLAHVLDDIRPLLVPALVERLDDDRMLRVLTGGGALAPELSTTIIVQRRDAAVAVVASEYDMRFARVVDFPTGGGG